MSESVCLVRYAREIRVTTTCYLIDKWFPSLDDTDRVAKFIDALPEFRNIEPETLDYWIRWGDLIPRHMA